MIQVEYSAHNQGEALLDMKKPSWLGREIKSRVGSLAHRTTFKSDTGLRHPVY